MKFKKLIISESGQLFAANSILRTDEVSEIKKLCRETLIQHEKMLSLIKECNEYLNTNDQTNIGNGSILHKQFIEIVNQNDIEKLIG